jgi:hypothetical protein
MRRLLKPLWILFAVLFLFEAWLWSHLAPLVAWLVARIDLPRLKARVASWVEHLPPAATLVIFVVPVLVLLPIKFLGFWLLAHGSWLGAMATLALAKVVSMAVMAFIFEVTRPKLLQLAWFRWLYERVLAGLAWAHRYVDPIKERMRVWARTSLAAARRRLRSLFWLLQPRRSGRFLRRVLRLRRRLQARLAQPRAAP